ncbi:MAG: SurA N-terminal domain-containing protein [Paracoccus sp. (in: a-proteobacteria)]|nr:SurA N-terminal domain-containing protein [Paracoccus sp. (in: a-proteobacteria)]
MSSLRTKGKSTIVWILMGLLLLGLAGFGVTNFAGGDTDIGRVGQTKISGNDYYRALNSELQASAMQTGTRMSIDEARASGITQGVLSRLVLSAVLEEDARLRGVSVGDAQVARVISEAPAFRGAGGGFDRALYADTLRREGMSERAFENDVRMDEARLILQRAIAGGAAAPQAQVDEMVGWIVERRDISWMELTAAELATPIAEPADETLEAWHQANADRFTAPEQRRLTYIWMTPETLAERIELDEVALRQMYDAAGDRYQQPERRMVSRIVFQDAAAAAEARARLDAGEIDFDTLAAERGLSPADADLGIVTEAQLGAAGPAVFAASDNGILGPLDSEFGPALFSLNAIMDPVEISYEEALPDLRAEAAADRAARVIAQQTPEMEDLLAGGASLEQMAEETEMELGQLLWTADMPATPGEITGYPSFRAQAEAVRAEDFPRLFELEDGGLYALRLDEVIAPALIPFEEVRGEVAADWIAAETRRQLLELAEQRQMETVSDEMNGAAAPAAGEGEPASGGAAVAPAEDGAAGAAGDGSAPGTAVTAGAAATEGATATVATEPANATETTAAPAGEEAPAAASDDAPATGVESDPARATDTAAPATDTAAPATDAATVTDAPATTDPATEPSDEVMTPPALPGSIPPGAGQWASETGLTRDGYIEAAPQYLVSAAFDLAPGEVDVVDAEGRVLLVRVDAVDAGDPQAEELAPLRDATAARLSQSLQGDLFEYYIRALQQRYSVELNQSQITAIESRM